MNPRGRAAIKRYLRTPKFEFHVMFESGNVHSSFGIPPPNPFKKQNAQLYENRPSGPWATVFPPVPLSRDRGKMGQNLEQFRFISLGSKGDKPWGTWGPTSRALNSSFVWVL